MPTSTKTPPAQAAAPQASPYEQPQQGGTGGGGGDGGNKGGAPNPPAPAAPRYNASNPPPVGTKVAFRLRLHGEWVEAVVIDRIPGGNAKTEPLILDDPEDERIHLAVTLNKARHASSGTIAYRQNVAYGNRPGQWLPEAPANAKELYAAAKQREQDLIAVRRQAMRGEMITGDELNGLD